MSTKEVLQKQYENMNVARTTRWLKELQKDWDEVKRVFIRDVEELSKKRKEHHNEQAD